MADAIKTKLQKLSGEYSAKVEDIRDLKADLRKPFVTDAEAKVINTKIKKLDNERLQINTELNKLTKLAKTAEEYIKLNEKLKTLESNIAKADERGESTVSFKRDRNAAVTRLKAISSDVERSFPEIKVEPPKISTTPTPAPTPTPTPTSAPTLTPTPAQTPKPSTGGGATGGNTGGTPGKAVPSNFNVGSFRKADEASMAKVNGVIPPGDTTLTGDVFAQAQSKFGGIDEVFKTNDELKKLLIDAINGKWGIDRFTNELENTKWFKTNAGPIRQRGFYKRQYDALVSELKNDDPNYQSRIDELNRTSEWGRGLENASETVIEEWTRQYGTPTTEDLITIKSIASELYQYANEADAVKIRNLVLAKPKRFSPTAILGGDQGENISSLKAVAAANGLNLDKDFATSIQTWLDRLAKGESIETIKSIIRNTAKTTWNVNDRISGLLDQGVDLDTIYTPYKIRMANLLEIAPGTITFDDLASKGIIGGKEEKNLYDFEKELRKDARWQYTGNAREEVSNSVLGILKDFGFQG